MSRWPTTLLFTTYLFAAQVAWAGNTIDTINKHLNATQAWKSDFTQLKADEVAVSRLWKNRQTWQTKKSNWQKQLETLRQDQIAISHQITDTQHNIHLTLRALYTYAWSPDGISNITEYPSSRDIIYASHLIDQLRSQEDRLRDLRDKLRDRIHAIKILSRSLKDADQQIQQYGHSIRKHVSHTPTRKATAKPGETPTIQTAPYRTNHAFKPTTWPARGKITQRFHAAVPDAPGIYSKGIEIAAHEESPILAVDAGKVVYADWLPYYGMTIIIDHGHQWYTLYGHALSTFVEVNDVIKPGQYLGLVGHTGGITKPSLYFAIKHNGEPYNPLRRLPKQR